MKIRIIIAFIIATLITGCSSIDCSLTGKVLCHYTFQNADGEDATLAYPISVTFSRPLADEDTVYVNQESNISTLDIPMSHIAQSDAMTFTLHITDESTISDNITISKTDETSFESVDCPARYKHTIQNIEYTRNFIDTIIINDKNVGNDPSVTNIYIRLRSSN